MTCQRNYKTDNIFSSTNLDLWESLTGEKAGLGSSLDCIKSARLEDLDLSTFTMGLVVVVGERETWGREGGGTEKFSCWGRKLGEANCICCNCWMPCMSICCMWEVACMTWLCCRDCRMLCRSVVEGPVLGAGCRDSCELGKE